MLLLSGDNSPCHYFISCVSFCSRLFSKDDYIGSSLETVSPICDRMQIYFLTKIAKIISPLGAMVGQIREQLLKKWSFLNSSFLSCDTELLYVQHPPRLPLLCGTVGMIDNQYKHEVQTASCAVIKFSLSDLGVWFLLPEPGELELTFWC